MVPGSITVLRSVPSAMTAPERQKRNIAALCGLNRSASHTCDASERRSSSFAARRADSNAAGPSQERVDGMHDRFRQRVDRAHDDAADVAAKELVVDARIFDLLPDEAADEIVGHVRPRGEARLALAKEPVEVGSHVGTRAVRVFDDGGVVPLVQKEVPEDGTHPPLHRFGVRPRNAEVIAHERERNQARVFADGVEGAALLPGTLQELERARADEVGDAMSVVQPHGASRDVHLAPASACPPCRERKRRSFAPSERRRFR